MFNIKQNNMNNVQFKPEGQLKEMGVKYSVKAMKKKIDTDHIVTCIECGNSDDAKMLLIK